MGYQDGKPLHVANKEKSLLAILSHETFEAMSEDDVLGLLQQKNVVVTGVPQTKKVAFDKHGLRTLSALDSQVSIQGTFRFSVSVL